MSQSVAEYVLAQQEKKFVGIPLALPRLNKLMCGIDKGDSWLITAQTSTFKSAFTMACMVIPAVEWILERLDSGLDIKVFYFLLEENHRDLEIRILSHLYMREFGWLVSENKLHGRGDEKLSPDELHVLPKVQAILNRLLEKIEIIDSTLLGYPMYLHVKQYMEANGKITTDGLGRPQYVSTNPDQYVLMVVDHVGDMIPSEEEKTLFQAIENLTGKYLMKLKNFYRVIPVIVQQQTNTGDSINTDYKGKIVESKLSPSTADLADNKGSARRALQIISLFNPAAYELEEYKQYKYIKVTKDNFLYLEILKNRRGPKKVGGGIWVDPVSKTFEEFPAAPDVSGQINFLSQKGIGLPPPGNDFGFDDIGSKRRRINTSSDIFQESKAA